MCQLDDHCLDARMAGLHWIKACIERGRKVLAVILVASVLLVPHVGWAACQRTRDVKVEVSAETADIAVRTDYSFTDLARLAGLTLQSPPHRVLGFYADAVGFRLHTPTLDIGDCADVIIKVQLVTTRRVIELASNIERCLFDAALRHYRHHAELQAHALDQSGRALQPVLRQFVADALSSDEGLKSGSGTPLSDRARAFVTQWLNGFRTAALSLQAAGDSPAELQALHDACSV